MRVFLPFSWLVILGWCVLGTGWAGAVEYVPYVTPFAPEGSVVVKEAGGERALEGASMLFDPVPASAEMGTGEGGGVSLLLGETGEFGTARLGGGTRVRLPARAEDNQRDKKIVSAEEAVKSLETAGPHSLTMLAGRVYLRVKTGQAAAPPIRHLYRWSRLRQALDFVVGLPLSSIATREGEFFCISLEGVETVGVHEGSVRVTAARSPEPQTLNAGQAVEIKDGVFGNVRPMSEAEREAGVVDRERAALKIEPLDVSVTSLSKGAAFQSWTREGGGSASNWKEWTAIHSSINFKSPQAKLTEKGTVMIQARSPVHKPVHGYQIEVREGEPAADPNGLLVRPQVARPRLKALKFKMRVINVDRIVHHVKENTTTPEHAIFLNSEAGEWQDYHVPLIDAPLAAQKPDLQAYWRFDFVPGGNFSQVKGRDPLETHLIEMKDFQAVLLK